LNLLQLNGGQLKKGEFMPDPICTYKKFFNDWFEVCRPNPIDNVTSASVEGEDKGSLWGKLLCSWKCQNYDGYRYDYKTDICICKGDYRPVIWRR